MKVRRQPTPFLARSATVLLRPGERVTVLLCGPARIPFDAEALRANPPEGVTVSATDYYDFPHLAQE